jgi:AAA ATPase domain
VTSALVGRSAELASLLAACHDGSGGLVLLAGCAGSGKTTLLEELTRRLTAAGALAGSGHAVPGAGPFRPVAEALVRVAPPSLADDEQVCPFRAVLARILPTWPSGSASGVHLVDPVVVLGEAVLALLRVLSADRRTVLVLDDAHWADRDTLALLEYLAGGLHDVGSSIVVAMRGDEAGRTASPRCVGTRGCARSCWSRCGPPRSPYSPAGRSGASSRRRSRST